MLKKIGAKFQTKAYLNFNEKDESFCFVEHEGTLGSNLGDIHTQIETGVAVCVTERGNYIITEFADLYHGKTTNLASGVSVEAKGEIIYKGKVLKEDFREKADYDDYAVIKNEKGDAVFYPVKIDENDVYVQYNKERNAIEFISVMSGNCEAKVRNTVKAGVCFSNEEEFIRENAEPFLFNACSIETAGY